MHDCSIHQLSRSDDASWADCMRIYHASFPSWEREPPDVIAARMATGRYTIHAAAIDGKVIGFHLLDFEDAFSYILFAFLAVDEDARGQGFGTQLTRHAIDLFRARTGYNWFLIEAEDQQARFYGRFGFKKLDFQYFSPSYDDETRVPMHLMAIPADERCEAMDLDIAKKLVERLYMSGYSLARTDPRIQAQIDEITVSPVLIAWPPARPSDQ
ncbi:MAG: GNAT family N-acetyltransferase [Pseudomonadota bacterium]